MPIVFIAIAQLQYSFNRFWTSFLSNFPAKTGWNWDYNCCKKDKEKLHQVSDDQCFRYLWNDLVFNQEGWLEGWIPSRWKEFLCFHLNVENGSILRAICEILNKRGRRKSHTFLIICIGQAEEYNWIDAESRLILKATSTRRQAWDISVLSPRTFR